MVEAVALGEINNASIHFKKNKLIVAAVAHRNHVKLYSLDSHSLEIKDLSIRYVLSNSFVEQVKFINDHELLILSENGTLLSVTYLTNKFPSNLQFAMKEHEHGIIKKNKTPFYQKMLPPLHFWNSGNRRQLIDMIYIGKRVYCLIRIRK